MSINIKDYKLLEYVEATGTQYVNTNITPHCFGRIELCGTMTANATHTLWCARNNTNTTMTAFYLNTNAFRIDYGNGDSSVTYSYPLNTPFIIMEDANQFRLNGYRFGEKDPLSFTVPNPITFFNAYGSSQSSHQDAYAKMKFHWCRTYDNDNQIQAYFIPAIRKSDNKVGIIEVVNGNFYSSNSGTELIASANERTIKLGSPFNGNNLVYQECEYIETTDEQFCYTGVTDGLNVTIDCHMYASSSKGQYWYGSTQNSSAMMYNGLYNLGHLEYNWKDYTFTSANDVVMTQEIYAANQINIRINGKLTRTAKGTTAPSGDIYIFGCNNGNRKYGAGLRCYYFRIKDGVGNTIVKDFIPAYRKGDGKPVMYNKNGHTVSELSGTGLARAVPKTDLPIDIVSFNNTKLSQINANVSSSSSTIKYNYRPVAYIKTTGSQYMGTGAYPYNGTTRLRIEERYTELNNSNINGCYDSSGNRFHIGWWNNAYHPGIGNGYGTAPSWSIDRKVVILDAYNRRMQINGTNYPDSGWTSPTTSYTVPNLPIFIGARNDNGTPNCYTNGQQIYKVIIDNASSGTIAKYLIPVVRNSDGKTGLLDLITNTFFQSVGGNCVYAEQDYYDR